jgi:predicted nucleic acid-binding protein
MITVDTNLLVYAHRSAAPEHKAAIKSLEKAFSYPGGWGIAFPSIAEFWCGVTHPKCTGRPSRPEEAEAFISTIITDGNGQIFLPSHGFTDRLMHAAEALNIIGARFFDLQIGLIAIENGAHTLWTHDANFLKIPGLKITDPLIQ